LHIIRLTEGCEKACGLFEANDTGAEGCEYSGAVNYDLLRQWLSAPASHAHPLRVKRLFTKVKILQKFKERLARALLC
jgi:hypothetical protein